MAHFRYRGFVVAVYFVSVAQLASAQGARPEYSDKEKRTLDEIARRPEIVQEIEDNWASMRRQDVEFAFRVNSASQLQDGRALQSAEFLTKYGQQYDNPFVASYVNALGQRLVPKDSPNLYTFRVLLDPTPRAESLSTGTIYVSTGLVALVDNEAQLAYVLGHEIAHLENRHSYNALRGAILERELNKEHARSTQKKKNWLTGVAAVAGAIAGGVNSGLSGATGGAILAGFGGELAGALIFRNRFEPTQWDSVYENEADETGLTLMLEQRFDGREVPRLYARLSGLVARDSRVGLGFISNAVRVQERSAHIQGLLSGPMKARIDAAAQGTWVSSSPDFSGQMAALKRDNGVLALDYDLLPMARQNLEEAAQLRPNDPRAQYYLGKAYALIGRTAEDKQKALTSLQNAIRVDTRGSLPGPHLEYALNRMAQSDPGLTGEVREALKKYVTVYQREHAGALPPNMYIIYDYLLMAGEDSWYVPPAAVIAAADGPAGPRRP